MWNRPPEKRLQEFASNGIFTTSTTDPDWASIHGLLPRAFNALKVKGFYPASETARPRARASAPACDLGPALRSRLPAEQPHHHPHIPKRPSLRQAMAASPWLALPCPLPRP